MRPLRIVVALLALVACGCALGPLDKARLALGSAVSIYFAVEGPAVDRYAAATAPCVHDHQGDAPAMRACLDAVKARWASESAAITALYRVVTAALDVLHAAEALDAKGGKIDAAALARAAGAALDAGLALKAAFAPSPPQVIP